METIDMKPKEFRIALAAARPTQANIEAGRRYDVIRKCWIEASQPLATEVLTAARDKLERARENLYETELLPTHLRPGGERHLVGLRMEVRRREAEVAALECAP